MPTDKETQINPDRRRTHMTRSFDFNRPVAETRKPRWRETGRDHQQIRNAGDSNFFPLLGGDHAR